MSVRFYLCRRGAKGKPEKYGFEHVEGAGLARCPFFGLWVCGGFGEVTPRLCRQVRRRRAEGFWEEDETWFLGFQNIHLCMFMLYIIIYIFRIKLYYIPRYMIIKKRLA